MTDVTGTVEDRLDRRIRGAFASELLLADLDLAKDPIVARRLRNRPRFPTAAGLVLLTLAVVGGAVGLGGFVNQLHNPVTPASEPSEAARYADGIPMAWEGERVLRWDQVLAMRGAAPEGISFLAGVWIDTNGYACASSNLFRPSESSSDASPRCMAVISADAGAPGQTLSMVATLRYAGVLTTGPAIVRGEINDPQGGSTGASNQCAPTTTTCDPAIVIDAIVWSGDSYTMPQPISVAAAQVAVHSATGLDFERGGIEPGNAGLYLAPGGWAMTRVSPTDSSTRLNLCSTYPTDTTILVPQFMDMVGLASNNYIQPLYAVFVLPSSAALARALPGLEPGVAGALSSSNLMPPTVMTPIARAQGREFSFRWLVSGNVAVAVLINAQPTTDDKLFLNRLDTALRTSFAAGSH